MRVVVCEPRGEAAGRTVAAVHGVLPRSFDWVLKRQDSRKLGSRGVRGYLKTRERKAEGGKVDQDCFM